MIRPRILIRSEIPFTAWCKTSSAFLNVSKSGVFSEEIANNFSLDNINGSPAIFDDRKLLWMNGEYIRMAQNLDLRVQILELDPGLKEFDQDLLVKLIEPAKSRMKTLVEFRKLIEPFISKNKKPADSQLKSKLSESFGKIDQWTDQAILEEIKVFLETNSLKFPDLYELLIGARQGLPLSKVFEILGKEKTLSFLQ